MHKMKLGNSHIYLLQDSPKVLIDGVGGASCLSHQESLSASCAPRVLAIGPGGVVICNENELL